MPSISHHLSNDQLERYRLRRMAPAELLAADDHLGECDACYENLDGSEHRSKMLGSVATSLLSARAGPGEHPGAEELFDYADERLDQASREAIEAHLEDCADCRAQVLDLQDVKFDMASAPRTYGPRISRPEHLAGRGWWQARPVQIGVRI